MDGANYLIPVDARLERDTDVYDEGLSLDRILIAIEPAKKLRLVILDACRDNPFSRTMKRTVASRAIGQGLAKVEPTSPNVLIAYSAKAGSTAADGDGKNSPFTAALSHHLDEARARRAPGIRLCPRRGAQDHGQQAGTLCVWFARRRRRAAGAGPGAGARRGRPAAPALSAQAEARRDYELALQIGNKSALNAFLAQYPDGFYASLAKLQLDKIAAEETRVAATEKARLAEQERARLAAEGAQKSQQAKAEAEAKAAEQARIAAEKAKQVAQDQAAAAEQKRVAAESAAADKASAPAPDKDKAVNVAALARGAAAGRRHQIGAGRTAPRRLPDAAAPMATGITLAAVADAVQPLCRNQARHQGRQRRYA